MMKCNLHSATLNRMSESDNNLAHLVEVVQLSSESVTLNVQEAINKAADQLSTLKTVPSFNSVNSVVMPPPEIDMNKESEELLTPNGNNHQSGYLLSSSVNVVESSADAPVHIQSYCNETTEIENLQIANEDSNLSANCVPLFTSLSNSQENLNCVLTCDKTKEHHFQTVEKNEKNDMPCQLIMLSQTDLHEQPYDQNCIVDKEISVMNNQSSCDDFADDIQNVISPHLSDEDHENVDIFSSMENQVL